MKRILAVLLAVVLLFSLCSCSRAKSPDGLEPGTYTAAHPQFPELRQKYFDYFWNFFGINFFTTNENGTYNDEDMLAFAFVYLFRGLGEDVEKGVTQKRLNEITKQYAGHTVTEFDTANSRVDPQTNLVFPTTYHVAKGDLLVLQSLVVNEDGTREATLNRCVLPEDFWAECDNEQQALGNIVSENYAALGSGFTVYPVRIVFTAHLDKNDKEYLTITFKQNASTTKTT